VANLKSIIFCFVMLCSLRRPEVSENYITSTFGSKRMPSNKPARSGCLLVSCFDPLKQQTFSELHSIMIQKNMFLSTLFGSG
jgi:hypothetical protein